MHGKTESEGFRGSLPARRTNPEGWQVAWWPCIKFSLCAARSATPGTCVR